MKFRSQDASGVFFKVSCIILIYRRSHSVVATCKCDPLAGGRGHCAEALPRSARGTKNANESVPISPVKKTQIECCALLACLLGPPGPEAALEPPAAFVRVGRSRDAGAAGYFSSQCSSASFRAPTCARPRPSRSCVSPGSACWRRHLVEFVGTAPITSH